MPFRMEQPPKLRESHDVNRVSPFRKGIDRFAPAPDKSPQPRLALGAHAEAMPPMRDASHPPYGLEVRSLSRLARRHGGNPTAVRPV
jgi:hypothetical protein